MKTKLLFLAGVVALCAPILAASAFPVVAPSKPLDAPAAAGTLHHLAGWDSGGGQSCAALAHETCSKKYEVNSAGYTKCFTTFIKYQC